jgi:anaerobic selenocysteine-containing dehydrogenase
LIQSGSIANRFFARLGASRLQRDICGNTGGAGIYQTNGSSVGILPEDVVHARFIILWGTNTIVTNLHLWPFIREAKARGATIVVIDPQQTRTAAAADWHVQPLPGSDSALALGMMHVIVAEGLHDPDYIADHTIGFEPLRERLADYPPERVAALTGLDADEITRLARAYATTRPSLIRTLVGMEHRAHGAMTFRTVACLPALVGAWRELGGGHLHMTAGLHLSALNTAAVDMPELEDPSIRQINMVQIGRALTDPALDPPIQALVVYGSNPAVIAPSQALVLAGLRRDDLFTVVHEQFLTDTARHADYVLPATTQIEHLDLMWSWGHAYLALNQPAIEPLGEALSTTEFFRRLAARMGLAEPYLQDSDELTIRAALDSDHPYLDGITFERLQAEGWARLSLPEPWLPFAEGGFRTWSGKAELYSEKLAGRGFDPLPTHTPAAEQPTDPAQAARYPLALIAAKSALHFLNSSYAALPHHRRAEREPLLEIHPRDAAARGIEDGDVVRAFNERGAVDLHARVGERVRPGVVSMPFGWWPSHCAGGTSANVLTPDGLSDWGGGGDFHDVYVEVTRMEAVT